jgi:hypothetical protein
MCKNLLFNSCKLLQVTEDCQPNNNMKQQQHQELLMCMNLLCIYLV